jgi:membrane protein DedA with SNARE-associated domain
MPPELALFIGKYGYLAVFGLVFLQEIGFPNPVPNELVLLFSGYLVSIGTFSLPVLFLVVVSADFIGTALLYGVFYFFEEQIFRHKPKWLPLSRERIERIGERVSKKGFWGILAGRLIPYVRGYTSVAAGALHVRPRTYLTAVIISALIWSGGYAILGSILGKYWEEYAPKIGAASNILLALFATGVVIAVIYSVRKAKRSVEGN